MAILRRRKSPGGWQEPMLALAHDQQVEYSTMGAIMAAAPCPAHANTLVNCWTCRAQSRNGWIEPICHLARPIVHKLGVAPWAGPHTSTRYARRARQRDLPRMPWAHTCPIKPGYPRPRAWPMRLPHALPINPCCHSPTMVSSLPWGRGIHALVYPKTWYRRRWWWCWLGF